MILNYPMRSVEIDFDKKVIDRIRINDSGTNDCKR